MLSGLQKSKRPRDPNQLGKLIVYLSVGESDDSKNMPDDSGKDPAAVALGKKGGKARAEALSAKKRNEIAKNAANAMWNLGKYIFIQYQPSSLGHGWEPITRTRDVCEGALQD